MVHGVGGTKEEAIDAGIVGGGLVAAEGIDGAELCRELGRSLRRAAGEEDIGSVRLLL
jgi:hypothetical protein